ncbi:MAG: CHAT domain-containing protein [Scytonematopsis contorta HA4267-MV1]|jgi:CHAT domain-containing protein|nr:CHAT domain-containing protein [Scytonematopsis contorta HA4267-MV1]
MKHLLLKKFIKGLKFRFSKNKKLKKTFSHSTRYSDWVQFFSLQNFRIICGLLAIVLTVIFIRIDVSHAKFSTNQTALVQAANTSYQAERFAEAITQWQQVHQMFVSQGDKLNAAGVLNNLALAYQQLGKLKEANNSISESLKLISFLEKNEFSREISVPNAKYKIQKLSASALNIKGSLLLSAGKAEDAFATWKQAADNYEKAGDKTGLIRCLLNQTQALKELGLYRRVQTTLEQVNKSLQSEADSLLKVSTLLNLGDTLRVMGDLNQSRKVLLQSLSLAQKLRSPSDISRILLSLGNTARSRSSSQEALNYYQQAIEKSPDTGIKIQAQLNKLRILVEAKKIPEAKALVTQVRPLLENLPASRTTVYAWVNFGESIKKLNKEYTNFQEIAKVFAQAAKLAETIDDDRAESYALGYLAEVYEQNSSLNFARDLTEKALTLAQASNAPDIAYRWQWQLGRILKANGKNEEAIILYNEAVKTLGYIRNDLVASNINTQYSFRESVEPVYREFVGLLLEGSSAKANHKVNQTVNQAVPQKNLKQARQVIESLQLAELDNYFQEPCLKASPTQIDQIDSQAGVIYPIVLRERLEIILSLPNQPLRNYSSKISESELDTLVKSMRRSFQRHYPVKHHLAMAQTAYNLLIKPLEADLQASGVKTLTFVLDGALKNLPMGVLHDGKEYLIEKYNIALTPGLQLLASKPLENKNLKVLIGGLSEERQEFTAIPNVEKEISQIQLKVSTKVLFNQNFTSQEFQKQMAATSYPIVHLATHGEFSSNAADTFILTWDNRLDVKQLGEILQTREEENDTAIELLVLSACKTASGDNRAPLGIAGVAVRSGARSTVATLWSVDDQSTSKLMVEFYKQLSKSKVTRAEVLRRAQLELLKNPEYSHPYFWAPFIMVGSWL